MASVLAQQSSRLAANALKQQASQGQGVRLIDHFSREVVDDIFGCALKKQTGVSLKYMCVAAARPPRSTRRRRRPSRAFSSWLLDAMPCLPCL